MGVIDRVRSALAPQRAADTSITVSDWAGMFGYLGSQYGYPLTQTLVGGSVQQVDGNFPSYVAQAYKGNGIVFACMNARMRLFSEARFQFRQLRQGRPGDLFGTQALGPLETPWPGGTTGDLLARAIQDADIAGNFYAARRPGPAIRRLRPDWVTLVLGSENDASIDGYDIDAELVGLVYHPGGMGQGREPEVLLRGEFAHFAPIPDPLAAYRGMSWITPIVREVMGDTAATDHKLRFFENGATPNMVVSLDKEIQLQAFNDWVSKFREREPKGFDAYKTLYLGAGAKAEVVGANLQQLDFKVTQGAGETRIAAAAGVPPIIVGLSEGLQAATYSNYGQARRAFADGTMRPLWRNFAGSMQPIIDTPPGAELWYDDRDIPFLAEDQRDRADIQQINAQAIKTLVDAGFKTDAVIAAIEAGDMGRLAGEHTGLFSVQLQAPGSTKMPQGEVAGEQPIANGTAPEKPPINPAATAASSTNGSKPT